MQHYKELNLEEKISKHGFYCPSDSVYFNQWTKPFILSAVKHAPWAHIHVHIFDMTDADKQWCDEHNVSYSQEVTPVFENITNRDYWVNVRFCRLSEIYQDNVPVIAIDSDSLFTQNLSEEDFLKDMSHDWVTYRDKGAGSLGSCVGFAANGNARHLLKERLLQYYNTKFFAWFRDQVELDIMLQEKSISKFSMKYSDHKCRNNNVIWTGKGDRKYKGRFAELYTKYKEMI
jgi:hypothetical protein